MAGDTLVCRHCGSPLDGERASTGPRRSYCAGACRQAAYKARLRLSRAAEVADLALASTHARLTEALAALPGSMALTLRDELSKPSERNLSPSSGNAVVYARHNDADGVVVALHNPKEG